MPEDIGWALRIDPAGQVWVVHTVWAAGDEPAAYVTTYLPPDAAGAIPGVDPPGTDEAGAPAADGRGTASPPAPGRWRPARRPGQTPPGGDLVTLGTMGEPAALYVEMQPPPPSVARSLRLSAGQSAVKVTVRFEDPGTGRPPRSPSPCCAPSCSGSWYRPRRCRSPAGYHRPAMGLLPGHNG